MFSLAHGSLFFFYRYGLLVNVATVFEAVGTWFQNVSTSLVYRAVRSHTTLLSVLI